MQQIQKFRAYLTSKACRHWSARISWRWVLLLLLLLPAWFNYRNMLHFTAGMFNAPLEDMEHGWLIPVFSLILIVLQYRKLRSAAAAPSWRGAAWVGGFLVLAWFGARGGQSRLEQLSLIGLIWAVPYAFWGHGIGRLLRFPVAYLLFTVPVSSFVDFFTIHLRLISSSAAVLFMNGLGLTVHRVGTAIFSRVPGAEFNVDVANPCSGIQSFFAMVALTTAYAYLTQKTLQRQWFLSACSVPFAVIGNTVRIMSICLVALWFDQQVATGYYHDYSGFLFFGVGVWLMMSVGKWLERWSPRLLQRFFPDVAVREQATAQSVRSLPAPATPAKKWLPLLVTLLTLLFFRVNLKQPPAVYDTTIVVQTTLPATIGEFEAYTPWFCHNPQCASFMDRKTREGAEEDDPLICKGCGTRMELISLGEKNDLPQDTRIIKRNYHAPDGVNYAVSLVIGGRNRGSIHRAELCLPAQGYAMQRAQRIRLQLCHDQTLTARRITAMRRGSQELTLLYWFLNPRHETSSHLMRIWLDIWDRSIHNRINRWVMISLHTPSGLETPESLERMELFLSELYATIKPCHPHNQVHTQN